MLVITVALTGLSAGLGFVNAMGYIPAMENTPANHLLSFWQHADNYFRKRMPFFGNAVLLSSVITLVLLYKDWRSIAFLFFALAFLVSVGELIVIATQNLPVNKIIVTLDVQKPLGADFEILRKKAISAFYLRSILNLLAFAFTLSGVVSYLKTNVLVLNNFTRN